MIALPSRLQPCRLIGSVLAAAAALSLAACGSSAASAGAPASASAVASASRSPTPASDSSPASPSPGGLAEAADNDLGAVPPNGQRVFAEAPDGTVFFAAGSVVMVVGGDAAPAVAEQPGATVLGLGAGTSVLYVVTPQALLAYSRSTGGQTGRWPLTASPARPTSAGVAVGDNGTVWVWTDWATDQSGYEYATVYVVPSGAARAAVISRDALPGTLVTDGRDAFFLVAAGNSLGASLVEWQQASEADVTGDPAPSQSLTGFSRGRVVVYQSGSGLYSYAPGAGPGSGPRRVGLARTPVTDPAAFAATSSGLLFLTCTATACATVTQVDQATGAPVGSLAVPGSDLSAWLLLGPAPAVVTARSGRLHLLRLS